ncbi:MAG: lysozyme [Bacteroidia bacterium]|jgi:lysozyme
MRKGIFLLVSLLILILGLLFFLIYEPQRHILGYSVYGIDVSRWQEEIDWGKVKNDRIVFAFMKASQGVDKVDSFFVSNWRATDSLGIAHGAYHFYEPDKPPIPQLKNFISQVKLKPTDLPPVLDLEGVVLKRAEFQQNVQIWLDSAEVHFKKKPVIYCSIRYYEAHLKDKFSSYPIWIAQYKHFPYPKIDKSENRGWKIWQFSQTGKVWGVDGNVDLDVFNGSYEEFLGWKNRTVLSNPTKEKNIEEV